MEKITVKEEVVKIVISKFARIFEIKDAEKVRLIVENALAMTEPPPSSEIEVTSTATTAEEALSNFTNTELDSPEEKAEARKCIELSKNEEQLSEYCKESLFNFSQINTFEVVLAMRKMAELLESE